MPATVLEGWSHRAGAISAVAIDAIVRHVELAARLDGVGLTVVRVPDSQTRPMGWEAGWQIIVVLDEAQAVTGVEVMAGRRARGGRRCCIAGRLVVRLCPTCDQAHCTERSDECKTQLRGTPVH